MSAKTRIERDSMGEVHVPVDALYGAQTARAVENFPISGLSPHPDFIAGAVLVKQAAASSNLAAGRLDQSIAQAIIEAADEILGGQWREHFVVDPYQAGAGTSHNMNTNEVLANRANELLGGHRGEYDPVHPNDQVNLGQSSNDTMPTAARLAVLLAAPRLISAMKELQHALESHARGFQDAVKTGRTHLQDAVPVTLGDEFSGYANQIRTAVTRYEESLNALKRLNVGATALGTGMNAHPGYRSDVIQRLSEKTSLDLRPARNTFEVTQSHLDFSHVSSAMRECAMAVSQLANDIRLLGSGPRAGLAELLLPAVQPGSSIMPGKVNPSIAEMVNMVCFQVIGYDTTVTMGVQAGQLELNVMTPVIVYSMLWGNDILANAVEVFTRKCITGLEANRERLYDLSHGSISLATILTPQIGYNRSADIAKKSLETGRFVRDIVVEEGLMSEAEASKLLDPKQLAKPVDDDMNTV